jgi:hypothetical protein
MLMTDDTLVSQGSLEVRVEARCSSSPCDRPAQAGGERNREDDGSGPSSSSLSLLPISLTHSLLCRRIPPLVYAPLVGLLKNSVSKATTGRFTSCSRSRSGTRRRWRLRREHRASGLYLSLFSSPRLTFPSFSSPPHSAPDSSKASSTTTTRRRKSSTRWSNRKLVALPSCPSTVFAFRTSNTRKPMRLSPCSSPSPSSPVPSRSPLPTSQDQQTQVQRLLHRRLQASLRQNHHLSNPRNRRSLHPLSQPQLDHPRWGQVRPQRLPYGRLPRLEEVEA